MATLEITISEITEPDYDDVDETTKSLTAIIDDVEIPETYSTETTTSDVDAKNGFKSKLTAIGYLWDDEV